MNPFFLGKSALFLLVFVVPLSFCSKDIALSDPSAPSAVSQGAVDDDELDDLFDPFDESEVRPEEHVSPVPTAEDPSWGRYLRLGGELSLSAAVNVAHSAPDPGQTDWRGLSLLRARAALEADFEPVDWLDLQVSGYGFYDFAYAINGREDYTSQVLGTYEQDIELMETYALFSPWSRFDFWFGRQIVVWGVSDTIRVTDIINPLDRREPGMTDLEFMRLPVTMSRVDAAIGRWRLSGMAVHEIRFDKTPVFGSDFYPFRSPLPPEEIPSGTLENTELMLSALLSLRGWDLAFYAADHYDDAAHLAVDFDGTAPEAIRRHARLTLFGTSANAAVGNWLLKSEAAWQDGFEYFNAPGETFSRLDVLVGIEYSGVRETIISVEAANRHIVDFDDRLRQSPDFAQQDTFESAIRIVRDFLNDSLTCTLLVVAYGPLGEDGAFERFQAEYDLMDNWILTAGAVLYQSGDLPVFNHIGDNDRVFAEIAFHF